MDDNSKEGDCKENSGQQNNNTMATETPQTSSANTSKKDNNPEHEMVINQKKVNEKNNSCDIENATTSVPHGEKEELEHMDAIGNKGEASNMEIGSPQKRVTEDSDCSVPTIVNRDGINNVSGTSDVSAASSVPSHSDKLSPSNSSPKQDSPGTPVNKEPNIDFKVIYNKKKYDVSLSPDTDIGALKTHLQPIISIPPAMMKVMIKGLAKDEMTLKRLGVTKGSKIMVIGSSLNDVLQVSTTPKDLPKDLSSPKDKDSSASSSETCKQKQHKKVLDRGKPDDVMPGILGTKESLPQQPLSGMLNKHGGKVRLTFKLENDQVWIGTKERTEKLPLNSIKHVVSEPIDGHKEYHIVALQLGPTEASRYWVYWVPAQYVDAIKDAILGKWQLF